MKAISNIQYINDDLMQADPLWQRTVFAGTGVFVSPLIRYVSLLSSCGYIDLDADAVYSYGPEGDQTQYCTVSSPEDLIAYIKEMPSYGACLTDRPLGSFSKAELYWAVWFRIILARENITRADGSLAQEWCLYRIESGEDSVCFKMALIDLDDVDIEMPLSEGLTLDDALEFLCAEMNRVAEAEGFSKCRVCEGEAFEVPSTCPEVVKMFQETDAVFLGL